MPADFFSGKGEAVRFYHQFDFFFSRTSTAVSEVPAEHFSVVPVRAVWLFQWHLLISSPVWFFFFSSASTAVSEVPAEHFSAVEWSSPILSTRNNNLRWYWWGTLVYFWMSRIDWNNSMKCHCNWAIWASPIISLLTSLTTFVFMI